MFDAFRSPGQLENMAVHTVLELLPAEGRSILLFGVWLLQHVFRAVPKSLKGQVFIASKRDKRCY